jgi:hypothetical protein
MATHQAHLILGPEDSGRPLATEDFAVAEFREPWKYERVAGRFVGMSPEGQPAAEAFRI